MQDRRGRWSTPGVSRGPSPAAAGMRRCRIAHLKAARHARGGHLPGFDDVDGIQDSGDAAEQARAHRQELRLVQPASAAAALLNVKRLCGGRSRGERDYPAPRSRSSPAPHLSQSTSWYAALRLPAADMMAAPMQGAAPFVQISRSASMRSVNRAQAWPWSRFTAINAPSSQQLVYVGCFSFGYLLLQPVAKETTSAPLLPA